METKTISERHEIENHVLCCGMQQTKTEKTPHCEAKQSVLNAVVDLIRYILSTVFFLCFFFLLLFHFLPCNVFQQFFWFTFFLIHSFIFSAFNVYIAIFFSLKSYFPTRGSSNVVDVVRHYFFVNFSSLTKCLAESGLVFVYRICNIIWIYVPQQRTVIISCVEYNFAENEPTIRPRATT